MWWIQALEIADENGKRTGRWRLTATSDDEDGGGPFGDTSHDHPSAEEAEQCEQCETYCSHTAGMPSRKELQEAKEAEERKELKRLRNKYDD